MSQVKKYISVSFLILAAAVIAAVLTAFYYKHKAAVSGPGQNSVGLKSALIKSVDLPVPLGSPNVGLMFIHYFFSGSIKELKKADSGTQIILNTDNKDIPEIVATVNTPIAKVKVPVPANPTPPSNLSLSQLQVGQNVDVSMEFDPVLKHWLVLGIFLPSNKNP